MTPRAAVAWLIAVCLVWGVSFVAVKAALVFASPLVLLALRFGLATTPIAGSLRGASRDQLTGGLVLGGLFWIGFVFQTTGLHYTTPSRSAFITILSTPLVPLAHYVVYREPPGRLTLLAIAVATVGTYLLTSPGGGVGLNRGDVLTLGCAFAFAGQIVAAGHFAREMPIARLLAMELAVGGGLSLVSAPLLETPKLELTPSFLALLAFLVAGGLWSFHMQLRAQRVLTPTYTALVFCLEPVFAALASYAVFDEKLSLIQMAGAALILSAVAIRPDQSVNSER